ncbi:MAG: inositol monophosphatase family protein [Actinomycetota bacterium]
MQLTGADLRRLAELAVVAATEAGELIARSRPTDVAHKASGATPASQVVTDVDRASEALIVDRLSASLERFELALLTEERDDDGGRLAADHFWCIDPLDGTLPFIEGVPGYAVSIALVARDGTPLIGAIHDPVTATVRLAVAGGGAFRDGRPWSVERRRGGAVLSVFADRSFRARDDHDIVMASLDRVARESGLSDVRSQAPRGAVMNACGVLDDPPGCYLKFPAPSGGGSLWDFAATACLFGEAGAVATDIHGAPLDLNRPDSTFMNHRGVLFATDRALAGHIRAALHRSAD